MKSKREPMAALTGHKMRDLPGWKEASVEAAHRFRRVDGSEYQASIGNHLRVVGAFVAPPSVTYVSPDLIKAMIIGLNRQNWAAKYRAELAEREKQKVVDIRDVRARLQFRRLMINRINGDWSFCSNHSGTNPDDGEQVPGL